MLAWWYFKTQGPYQCALQRLDNTMLVGHIPDGDFPSVAAPQLVTALYFCL